MRPQRKIEASKYKRLYIDAARGVGKPLIKKVRFARRAQAFFANKADTSEGRCRSHRHEVRPVGRLRVGCCHVQ